MQKTVLAGVLTLVFLALVWGTTMAAEDEMCVPMDEITLSSLAKEAKRSEVAFPHATHFNFACQRCHHTWKKTEPIVGCTTSGCHDLAELPTAKNGTPVKEDVQNIHYYKNAYHAMCIGCHKEIKRKNKSMEASMAALGEPLPAAGPTGCIGCHPVE
jgi:Class III cytochrome C family